MLKMDNNTVSKHSLKLERQKYIICTISMLKSAIVSKLQYNNMTMYENY